MLGRTSTLLVVLALLGAGCIGTGTDTGEDLQPQTMGEPTVSTLGQPIVAHTSTGAAPLPDGAASLAVRALNLDYRGAEPTLGVTSDGTIFTNPFTEDESLLRSADHGRTWEEVGDTVANPKANLDPWMFVDPDTDRVFNGPLYVACSWLSWSDDQGETWDFNPIAGCGLPAHDHQKITAGPPALGVETDGYPNVVYYAYNGAFRGGLVGAFGVSPVPDTLDGTWVHTSYDGGETFTNAVRVFDPSPCKSGINGPVEVAPDGTAYVAHLTCEGVKVAVSEDSGASWDPVAHLTDQGTYAGLIPDPYLSTDRENNVYLATPGGDGLLYMAASTDRARQWTEPIPVTPPEVTFTVLPAMASSAPGHVAFAYVGTTDDVSTWDRPEPSYARDEAVWHLYYTYTTNALDEEPTFVTVRITPEDDPVQRGCIWLYGGGNACRNLLDFIDMVEHEGRPYLAYTDGCDACKTADDSRERIHSIAIVEQGPSLDGELLEPLVPIGE